ncbi:MAG: DUF2865 domain-containing protein [Pseudorhodoplanes sp.]
MARAGVALRYRRVAAIAALAALFAVEAPATASAQNLIEAIFGGFRRALTPRAPTAADPNGAMQSAEGALSSGYCVRLCDGRYFPVSGRGQMNAAEMCRAFCPATPTQIFSAGGGIANAVASNGQRYSALPNAFAYREKIVPDCSCTGKGPLGLVQFEETDDPTLRAGDIVATQAGLMAYQGDGRHAGFSPVDNKIGLPAKLKEQLTQTRVAPVATVATDGRATDRAPVTRNVDPRAQASR